MVDTRLAELIMAANIGVITFFTIAVAPTVFKVLPAQWAAKAGTGVMFFFSCWGLTPLINRSSDDGRLRTFKWLHGSSIALNIFQLGLFVWLLTTGAK
jgi:hypothetical protein